MTENNTIASVIKDGLCTGCGTCVSLCPNEAIEMMIDKKKGIYIPKLNEEKCNNCSICFKVCPGHSVDFKTLNLEIFGKEPEKALIGNYLNCYIGYSTDYDIRYNSSSGGLVTVLLLFALKNGFIDGALVTRMKKDNPLEPEPFIARTKEEIIEASKSKYCPVSANISLKEILNSKEGEKFAVVGLPCHIHGIRKAERVNKKLKEKIVLHLGLFCAATINFQGTEFLLQKMNFKKGDIKKIDYRGGGWPGSMRIKFSNNEDIVFVPKSKYYDSRFETFVPARCRLCADHTNELADISFGDAWLPELTKDKIGKSILICRNKIGKSFLQNALLKERMDLNKIDKSKVMQSQGMFRSKKNDLTARIFLFNLLNKKIPIYNQKLPKSRFGSYLRTVWLYFWQYISSKRYLWILLDIKALIGRFLRYFLSGEE